MAARSQLSYRLDPSEELVFRGPFDQSVSQKLRIENTGDAVAGFKVKTTAPRKFSVKPNIGYVEPHNFVDIAIAMPPFVYDSNERPKHKFMVQVVDIGKTMEISAIESLIKDCEKNTPTRLSESKLRVALVPSDQERHTNGPVNDLDRSNFVSSQVTNRNGSDLEDRKRLETDLSNLRQENSQLKEETAYQRKQLAELEKNLASSKNQSNSTMGRSGGKSAAAGGTTFQRLAMILISLLIGFAAGFYLSWKK